MKKKSIYIIALFLIAFTFLMPTDVFAKKKKIGTCTYTVDTETLFKGEIKKMTASINIYDNKTIKGTINGDGKKVTFTNSDSNGALSGKNVGAIYVKQPKNFYKAYEKYKESCPTLQFVYEMNSLAIYTDGGKVSESAASVMVDGVKTDSNGNTSSGTGTTYCTLGPQKVWNNNKEITATFFLKGKEKWVRLTSNSNNSNEFKYDSATTLDDIAFSVDSNSVKTFWSKSCKTGSTPIYFRTTIGNRSQIIIQDERPDDSENGAYTPAEAKYDNGGVKNTNPLNGLNHEYNECSQLIDTKTEGSFGWLLQKLLNYIKIAGPILVVLLSALDFIKAIASSEEDAFKKAQSRLVIRLIAALALFLVPTFVELLLGLINGIKDPSCGLK